MNTQLIDELVQTLRSISLEDRNAVLLQIQEDITRAKIQARIQGYEQQYNMSTEEFYDRFLTGELGDSSDYMDWAGSYEILKP